MNENSAKCPRCGATLAPDVPGGLCPRCLIALNFATQTELPGEEAGPGGTRLVKPPPPTPSPEEIARLFPQFEILGLLGSGGMGAVYKARQPNLDRLVALKILLRRREDGTADPAFNERFAREARALARLNHPNIVAVYDFGEAGGLSYLVMEYVDGLTLRELIRERKLTPEEALAIVPRICEALQFAHEQGIVHRDIKPENILLDRQGRVKIADFGIAKIVGQSAQPALTQDQQVMGTPHYMAPEQIEQPTRVDHRADIFSLGVVFYEMLTGELPLGKFEAPSHKAQIDVRLDEVVLHALEKNPERRYQHASEVKTDVETIAGSAPPAAAPPSATPPGMQPPGTPPEASGPSRLSRLAVVGAAWAPCFFVTALLMFMVSTVSTAEHPGPSWWQILLRFTLLPAGLTAPFGTTICGAISLTQIRRSAGRLYGLGLALFDVLLFPFFVFSILVGWFWWGIIHGLIREAILDAGLPYAVWTRPFLVESMIHWTITLLTLLTVLPAAFFITRWLWRAAKKPMYNSSTGPVPPKTGSSPNRGIAIVLGLVALLLLGVAVVLPLSCEFSSSNRHSRLMENQARVMEPALLSAVPAHPQSAMSTALNLFEALKAADQTLGEFIARRDAAGAVGWLNSMQPKADALLASLTGTVLEQRTRVMVERGKQLRRALQDKDWNRVEALYSGNPDRNYEADLRRLAAQPQINTGSLHRQVVAEVEASKPSSFGTVIERVLPCSAPCRMHYLQFHTGAIIAIGDGPGDTSDHAAEYQRAEQTGGLDISVIGGKDAIQLAGRGCIFASDETPNWDTTSAEQILQKLKHTSWLSGVLEIKGNKLPVTYLFKTARGETGMLQVFGTTSIPSGWNQVGVKLRYKLVRSI